MSVGFYWNKRDNDSRKMFGFMSKNDDSSICDLIEKYSYDIYRVENVIDSFNCVLDNLLKHDTVVFLTHGDQNSIYRYNYKKGKNYDHILISTSNANLLNNKAVIALCCSSARTLGRVCTNGKEKCKVFVGFENDVVYENKDHHSPETRSIIYRSYKKAFSNSLRKAIEKKQTAEDFKIDLLVDMMAEQGRAVLELDDKTLDILFSSANEGLVALGETKTVLFP